MFNKTRTQGETGSLIPATNELQDRLFKERIRALVLARFFLYGMRSDWSDDDLYVRRASRRFLMDR